jgi:hypothetical protein
MGAPEDQTIAAYSTGRAAALAGVAQSGNAFSFTAGGVTTLQAQAWQQGWIDATKDASVGVLQTLINTQRITKKFILSNAQILAFFTTPVQILAGLPNNVIIVYECMARKLATAVGYTIGGMTSMDLRWAGSATSIMRATTLAGWLDQATEQTNEFLGPAAATMTPDLGSVTAQAGVALNVLALGANPTGAGGNIELTFTYQYRPLASIAVQ